MAKSQVHSAVYEDIAADQNNTFSGQQDRKQLLAGLPVSERRLQLNGISTAVVEGGEGQPIILLHGPGEHAAKWLRVIPELVKHYRVIAPDLPAHGSTQAPDAPIDEKLILGWLEDLIESTCSDKPILVGHVLGGAIATRFAIQQSHRIKSLVLIDSLGLASFRPKLKFMLTMFAFLISPNERSYTRFMRQCSYDLDSLRKEMGHLWQTFCRYNLTLAKSPSAKVAGQLFRALGLPKIPTSEFEKISVPTTLIWGRHDRANRLQIAESISSQFHWPLHVIEHCADDPPRDQPAAFLAALQASQS